MKANALGMEQIAQIPWECCSLLIDSTSESIEGVTSERIPRGGKMDPDLMRAPGFDPDLEKRGIGAALRTLTRLRAHLPSGQAAFIVPSFGEAPVL